MKFSVYSELIICIDGKRLTDLFLIRLIKSVMKMTEHNSSGLTQSQRLLMDLRVDIAYNHPINFV